MGAVIRIALALIAQSILCPNPANAEDTVLDKSRPANVTSTVTSCEARTINYITHTLPQLCLTSAWSNSASPPIETSASPASLHQDGAPSNSSAVSEAEAPSGTGGSLEDTASDTSPTPFMSFEDWKEMMLRKTGQDPQDLRHRQANQHQSDDRTPPDMGHDGLGEEDEINLNFDSYLGKDMEQQDPSTNDRTHTVSQDGIEQAVVYEDGRASIHRSKDAGKTCKERFSYSSFDAGATVLKTSRGGKNAKAILVENKDSYMLLECSADSKFVIVELSDDILIDTVVLANFEFFSSMIRQFRVSVSDRYPVKAERWKELGHFEARNSRDIQPFLVENPQIWAKYVRIEFLTHFGNEYYCPVSLLRVHGSRMLDSWKDTESGRDDEGHTEDEDEMVQDNPQTAEVEPSQLPEVAEQGDVTDAREDLLDLAQSPVPAASELFQRVEVTCEAHPQNATGAAMLTTDRYRGDSADRRTMGMGAHSVRSVDDVNTEGSPIAPHPKSQQTEIPEDVPTVTSASVASPTVSPSPKVENPNSTAQTTSNTAISSESGTVPTTSISRPSTPNVSTGKNRTSATTSSSAASPTVQEGFFKAITKRLQQVESNLTLSLKYVEDQARHLQDTLQKTEHKQLSKVNLFLDTLNQTVLAELRNVREQYDEIWQSTVIALESQREQSEREIVALSTRLNFLADEVIFQKRMAIVQAVLLLSCLLLVIFSRGVTIPSLGPLMDQVNEPLFEAPALSSSGARGLYQPGLGTGINRRSFIGAQQGVDYIHDIRLGHDLSYHESLTHESPITVIESHRLSPPLTPGTPGASSGSDTSLSSSNIEANPARCAPGQYQQHSASRKPLPALPENPSSP
ncbi:Fc.00g006270.m01.CDS01 [Cosmosporella sp. VM-42]